MVRILTLPCFVLELQEHMAASEQNHIAIRLDKIQQTIKPEELLTNSSRSALLALNHSHSRAVDSASDILYVSMDLKTAKDSWAEVTNGNVTKLELKTLDENKESH